MISGITKEPGRLRCEKERSEYYGRLGEPPIPQSNYERGTIYNVRPQELVTQRNDPCP